MILDYPRLSSIILHYPRLSTTIVRAILLQLRAPCGIELGPKAVMHEGRAARVFDDVGRAARRVPHLLDLLQAGA